MLGYSISVVISISQRLGRNPREDIPTFIWSSS